jgi:hypothetical protein
MGLLVTTFVRQAALRPRDTVAKVRVRMTEGLEIFEANF